MLILEPAFDGGVNVLVRRLGELVHCRAKHGFHCLTLFLGIVDAVFGCADMALCANSLRLLRRSRSASLYIFLNFSTFAPSPTGSPTC